MTNLRKTPANSQENQSSWIHARHVDLLDEWLVKLHARELQKNGYVGLIVEEPPRHGKSVLATQYDSCYYLGAHPDERVILGTYAAEFGEEWGRKCRNTMEEWGKPLFGLEVDPESRAAGRWDIKDHNGGMYSVGAGGPITGRGADYLKADDLIKGHAEAQSETLRENTWQWWLSTFRTRLMPGGIILVIGTRWHEDDIIGRLLARQGDGPPDMVDTYSHPDADRFMRIRLPAIAEEPDEDFPEPDALGREPGEPLFPEMWPVELLRPHMANEQVWASLYQQRPTPKEGGLFKEPWFQMRSHPGGRWKKLFRRWDLAATEPKKGTDPDFTVGVLMGEHESGDVYILDVVRFRGTPNTVKKTLKSVRDRDGHSVRIRYEEEPGSAGKFTTVDLARSCFRGYAFKGVRSTGDKWLRAEIYAGALERSEVYLVRADWNREFIREHTRFTRNARRDDQVDAAAGAYTDLFGKKSGKVVTW